MSDMEQIVHIINNVPMACCLIDEHYKIVHCNASVAMLFSLDEISDCSLHVESLSPPFQLDGVDSAVKANALLHECITSGGTMHFDWLHRTPNKEIIPTINTLIRISVDGKYYVKMFFQDMRETKQTRQNERAIKQRLQVMLDSCPIACGIIDEHFNVIECNQEVVNLFGLTDKQAFMQRFFELSPEYQPDGRLSRQKALDKLKLAYEAGRAHFEWLHSSSTCKPIPCEVTMVRMHMNDSDQVLIYIQDLRAIRESLDMVEKMESIAFTDELTKLHTRRYFMENANTALTVCKALGQPVHIVMCDLDHFKAVNDTYGHLIGDEVLKIAAARMSNVTRQGTLLARYGGEEFIIMLTEISYDAAVKTAQRIQKSMEESRFMIKGLGIDVTVSLGVSTMSDPADNLSDLIFKADTALYTAKRTGRNKVVEYIVAKETGILVMK